MTDLSKKDWRNIKNGYEIPSEGYCDQPYMLKTDDGAILCVMTTGKGEEGQHGQHVISLRSSDYGKTWTEPVDVEPASGPEASYAVLLKAPSGRIFCFYNHNTDNLRKVLSNDEQGYTERVDSQGYFVFKYSDDDGLSWSEKRYNIPVRETLIDRENPYQGKVRFFWNVGKAFSDEGNAYVPLIKVGRFGVGFFERNEGWLLKSANLLRESDPEKISWETLPDGDIGLNTPPGGGPISAEQSYSILSDGSFYSVYRSIDGHPVCSYSRDKGHTWSEPEYKKFADGRLMKHNRAANFAWKCSNGKYLYLFHNHGGRDFDGRNPVWVCAGVETNSPDGKIIKWSQPQILFYDDDVSTRISYPDLLEENGRYFISETQKTIARIHEIDQDFLNKLWDGVETNEICTDGLIFEYKKTGKNALIIPKSTNTFADGFSIEMEVSFESLTPGQILFDNRADSGNGISIRTAENNTVEIILNDSRTENRWSSDPGMLETGKTHNIAVIVDDGPKVISFVIDGKFNDGGEYRQFGWGLFNSNLKLLTGEESAETGEAVNSLRIYNRPLMTTEIYS